MTTIEQCLRNKKNELLQQIENQKIEASDALMQMAGYAHQQGENYKSEHLKFLAKWSKSFYRLIAAEYYDTVAAQLVHDLNLLADLAGIDLPMEFWTQANVTGDIKDPNIKEMFTKKWEDLKETGQERQGLYEACDYLKKFE